MSEEGIQQPAQQLTEQLRVQRQDALPDDLPVGYYLENFHYLLRFVSDRYGHLLTAEEVSFHTTFEALGEPAQKLFVRLINRKGEYFRVDKLSYDEIPELQDALTELTANGLTEIVVPPIEDALKLCLRDELIQHSALKEQAKVSSKKQSLIEYALIENINPLEELDIPIVMQRCDEIVMVYRLLFFGNFHQDMTEFVLHELVAPFEQYDLQQATSLFSDRSVVEALIELRTLSELSYAYIEEDEQGDQLISLMDQLPDRSSEPLLARRFDRIVNRVSRQLERLDQSEAALKFYGLSKSAPARERQTRLLAKLGEVDTALDACEHILMAPENEEELEFAHHFGSRLAKKHNKPRDRLVAPDRNLECEAIEVPRIHDRVELSALSHYEQSGWRGYYVENSLLRSLFGLYFWDVIYTPVKGAFFHPFQRGPADLYSPDFVAMREDLIESRLRDLDRLFVPDMTRTLKEKYGTANQFVYWGLFDDQLLELCCTHLPTDHLKAIFVRMLSDLRNNTNGLPDLILFGPDDYRLVEIKGPGDKLQKNQIRWFQFFVSQGIPASVVNVEYSRD